VIYDVEFSLDAAAELLRIAEVLESAMIVLQAAEAIRRQLEMIQPKREIFFPKVCTTSTSNLFERSS
jgi:hypothetical protein